MSIHIDSKYLSAVLTQRALELYVPFDHGRSRFDIRQLHDRLDHLLGVFHAFDITAVLIVREKEIRAVTFRAARFHEYRCGLDTVLDPNRAIRSQDRIDKELLIAAKLGLRRYKETHPKDNSGQAHEHRALLGHEEPDCYANIGRHEFDISLQESGE